MTSSQPLAPAGWYPSPDGAPALRWWDGTQWTAQERPLPAIRPPEQQQKADGLAALATWTRLFLIGSAALSIGFVAHEIVGVAAMNRFLAGEAGIGELDAYDARAVPFTFAVMGATLLTGLTWIIWQERAARRVKPFLKRSPGWHAASWIIPVIALWFPYQNVSDLFRLSRGSHPRWLGVWWGLWVGGSLLSNAATQIALRTETLEEYVIVTMLSIASHTLLIAAVPLACLVVRDLTRSLDEAQISSSG